MLRSVDTDGRRDRAGVVGEESGPSQKSRAPQEDRSGSSTDQGKQGEGVVGKKLFFRGLFHQIPLDMVAKENYPLARLFLVSLRFESMELQVGARSFQGPLFPLWSWRRGEKLSPKRKVVESREQEWGVGHG